MNKTGTKPENIFNKVQHQGVGSLDAKISAPIVKTDIKLRASILRRKSCCTAF